MTDAAKKIEDLYIKEEGRVLDPTLLDKTLLERMPTPTGGRMLILPDGCRIHPKARPFGL